MTDYLRKEVIGTLLGGVDFIGFTKRVSIYAIVGEKTVYVGSTSQPIEARIRAHIGDAKSGSELPIHAWMRDRDYKFSVKFIEDVSGSERVCREKHWLRQFGVDLLNVTDGGLGMSGNYFAGTGHAEKIALKLRQGSNCLCEVCQSEFWRKPRDIRLGHNRFCSRSCYQEWQRGRTKTRKVIQ